MPLTLTRMGIKEKQVEDLLQEITAELWPQIWGDALTVSKAAEINLASTCIFHKDSFIPKHVAKQLCMKTALLASGEIDGHLSPSIALSQTIWIAG